MSYTPPDTTKSHPTSLILFVCGIASLFIWPLGIPVFIACGYVDKSMIKNPYNRYRWTRGMSIAKLCGAFGTFMTVLTIGMAIVMLATRK